ncbi:MAG: hypothetical protein LBP85_07165 [Prevotellaceae bacterium]|jgi:hypothetical protein|nr:hypothetical protein [Prevotellaceae bacterium]
MNLFRQILSDIGESNFHPFSADSNKIFRTGVNDCISDKKQLAKWFKDENVRINLLPFNKTIGIFRCTTVEHLQTFKKDLERFGLEVNIHKKRVAIFKQRVVN